MGVATDSSDQSEEAWCNSQRQSVAEYLTGQGVKHGRIGNWPAWHVTGCVAVWAIESGVRPEWIGWWVISGDLPTDYCSSSDIEPPQHPRKAIRVIADRWLKQVEAWMSGSEYGGIKFVGPDSHHELAPLIKSRAELMLRWADDDSMWEPE